MADARREFTPEPRFFELFLLRVGGELIRQVVHERDRAQTSTATHQLPGANREGAQTGDPFLHEIRLTRRLPRERIADQTCDPGAQIFHGHLRRGPTGRSGARPHEIAHQGREQLLGRGVAPGHVPLGIGGDDRGRHELEKILAERLLREKFLVPDGVFERMDDVLAQETQLRMVLMVERQSVGLARENPAQDPSTEIQRDKSLRAEQVKRTTQQRAFGWIGDVVERSPGDETRVALQPTHERVAVVELHRVGVLQAATPGLEAIIRLTLGTVKKSDARHHRRTRHPADDLIEQILQPVEVLGGLDEMLQAQDVALRPAARASAVLLHRTQTGHFVAEHLRFLHPADPFEGAVRHLRQRLPGCLDVLHPIDTGVAGRLDGSLFGKPRATITACGCIRPRRWINSSVPGLRRSTNNSSASVPASSSSRRNGSGAWQTYARSCNRSAIR